MSEKPLSEILARMWIDCDPNRMGNPLGSGFNADDPLAVMSEHMNGLPRWKWFEPRADAVIDYLFGHGYQITPLAALKSQEP